MLKKTKASVLLLALAVLCGCSEAEPAPSVGSAGSVQSDLTPSGLEFEAYTMSDSVFVPQDLADYELTMINVWQTTCPPCIREMPALNTVYENLPEGVNLVGICIDADYNRDAVKDILEDNNVLFETVIANTSVYQKLLTGVQATPTTIFVDSSGNNVGKPIIGSPALEDPDEVAAVYLREAESHKALLEGKRE